MLAVFTALLFATSTQQTRATALEPLLETNRPPYTLVNFALEQDTRVDQIGEIQKQEAENRRVRLNTQFSRRRDWLDTQFEQLRRKQMSNRTGSVSVT